ncbi:hypothetical protein TRSC58_01861 [Trypanosoma rangeli SC58]|uniref:Uncharacterized protein n=1 Tax=Trypanosoma rangeli SC58 TaxID=429131 RepID=A0A061J4Q0_TRYRA|nr:hypothetical protein TRSC58_01861 [Trypanosoma rangeli SC58]
MLTPQVTDGDCGEELRTAIFRVRLLLALHGLTDTDDHDGQESTVPAGSMPLSPLRESTSCFYSNTLHSVDLEDGSSEKCQLDGSKMLGHTHDTNSEGMEEEEREKFVATQALPLPPLRWQFPTLQQRLEAVEKRRNRRQKRAGRVPKPGWFRSNPVAAAAAVVCDDIDDANDDHQEENSSHHARTSVSSTLALTGDRSDRSSSQDTYSASRASTDDVYIHELAREHGSPLNASSTVHRRWGSASITAGGTRANFLSSPSLPQSAVLAFAGAFSESTAMTAQMEFDRIGTGEEAPYTSYLFSPEARIVDLSTLFVATDKRHETDKHKAAADACRRDGCTRVRFSPKGDCYIVGTERGKLWFVQVTVNPGGVTIATAGAPLLLQGHSGAVTDIAFDDVGTCFASAGADACVILWSQRTPTKIRRINTDGVVPVAVRFMPKNNNYILVSLPQHHLLCLYNTSTGFSVTRKGQLIRVQATALAVEPCTDPFLFLGDAHGAITVWRCRVSSVDSVACPSVVTVDAKEARQRRRPDNISQSSLLQASSSFKPTAPPPSLLHSVAMAAGPSTVGAHSEDKRRREIVATSIMEGQPQFEKIAGCIVEKGAPVASLVASSMNHQQFHCLLRAQHTGQEIPERSTVKRWAAAALGGGWPLNKGKKLSTQQDAKISARTAYAMMLLASFTQDRLVILSVQPSKSTPREYKLIPMLRMTGACRIRQMSVGTSFCVDNMRCPTISCTCEEGFVHIIACTPARPLILKEETTKRSCPPASKPVQWSVMATLPVPCGGIPRSLAWSPDMGLLVAVTEEGMLYEWRRVHLPHGEFWRGGEEPYRDDDDSTGVPRTLDEAEEWRICLHRERERQMRRYRARGGTDESGDSSLSGVNDWWKESGDSISQS